MVFVLVVLGFKIKIILERKIGKRWFRVWV